MAWPTSSVPAEGLEGAEKKSWVQAGVVPRGEGVWAHGVGEKEE
jgi:hypothetical protein